VAEVYNFYGKNYKKYRDKSMPMFDENRKFSCYHEAVQYASLLSKLWGMSVSIWTEDNTYHLETIKANSSPT